MDVHEASEITWRPPKGTTRAERAKASRREQSRRHRIAREVAEGHAGVATRTMLLGAGLTRGQIQVEVDRGVWVAVGRHTISVAAGDQPSDEALWWRALWESGERSVLDGPSALMAAGLTGWTESAIHITVPNRAKVRPLPGVVHHRIREIGPVVPGGLRRTRPEVAVVRAAQWAKNDRAAATIVAMSVQQGRVRPERLLERWLGVDRAARRRVLDGVIRDVCDGAHSLSELDFARLCRRRGLPEPSRQVIRSGRNGRVYLDVYWDDLCVHVEIHGAQHMQGTAGIEDALRLNDLGLGERSLVSLQIPVLGLRTRPDDFLDQVERALHEARELAG